MLILQLEDIKEGTIYLLPHELRLAQARLATLEAERDANVADMMEARAGSTENMGHDDGGQEGARDMSVIVGDRAAPVIRTLADHTLVDYPDENIGTVTIGSRVRVAIGSTEESESYQVDIVGPAARYEGIPGGDRDVERAPYTSPVARAIFGHKAGDVVTAKVGSRQVKVTIFSVDQDAQRVEFAEEAIAS
jgi:transcription elongation GreA/GreB family factor